MTKLRRNNSRSACPIATTLDIIGDRWTLVILRDMINGKKRFSEFLESPEHITTSVLTDRLNLIEAAGIAKRIMYQERPKRFEFELTEKGRDLLPVMQNICLWANKHYSDTWTPPPVFMKKYTL